MIETCELYNLLKDLKSKLNGDSLYELGHYGFSNIDKLGMLTKKTHDQCEQYRLTQHTQHTQPTKHTKPTKPTKHTKPTRTKT